MIGPLIHTKRVSPSHKGTIVTDGILLRQCRVMVQESLALPKYCEVTEVLSGRSLCAESGRNAFLVPGCERGQGRGERCQEVHRLGPGSEVLTYCYTGTSFLSRKVFKEEYRKNMGLRVKETYFYSRCSKEVRKTKGLTLSSCGSGYKYCRDFVAAHKESDPSSTSFGSSTVS